MLSVVVVSFSPLWNLVRFLTLSLLSCSVSDPVSPGAASSGPALPGAHPRQSCPPRFVVVVGHLVREI